MFRVGVECRVRGVIQDRKSTRDLELIEYLQRVTENSLFSPRTACITPQSLGKAQVRS